LIQNSPDLFWGLIASMYTGNVLLLLLNLPLIPMWVRLLKVRYAFLFPLIILFCLIGAYSINNNTADIIIMSIFGVLGYLMKKVGFEGAPMILAFVLGPRFENAFRQSLIMSHGSFMIFLTRPISLGFIVIIAILLFSPLIFRRKAFQELEEI
jgi:putative tricarboxylic transport membrane protein